MALRRHDVCSLSHSSSKRTWALTRAFQRHLYKARLNGSCSTLGRRQSPVCTREERSLHDNAVLCPPGSVRNYGTLRRPAFRSSARLSERDGGP